MIEIIPNLFVGNAEDYETQVKGRQGWKTVHACKYPYHKQVVPYIGRDPPQNHPEFYIAHRGNSLMLNLVDAPDPIWIKKEMIDAAIQFITEGIKDNKILVHCNQGHSRSPIIALLYLSTVKDQLSDNFNDAEREFKQLYPEYEPNSGMREFAIAHYDIYNKS